jgi:hypothetical protein
MDCNAISFSRHAVQRMFERAISPAAVRMALENGEAIADYPADTPYPSMLIPSLCRGTAIARGGGAGRQDEALLRGHRLCA